MGVRAVFLVGFMASGKSSVGKELARRLNWDFVDLDSHIEARERRSVPELFRDRGESGFRLVETAALHDLLNASLTKDTVVALGGGAFVQPINRQLLDPWPTVFLEAPISELWRRSELDLERNKIERPLRGDPDQFARLYQDRLPFYRQAKVTVVTSGNDLTSLCAEIERSLQDWEYPEDADPSRLRPSHIGTGESQ